MVPPPPNHPPNGKFWLRAWHLLVAYNQNKVRSQTERMHAFCDCIVNTHFVKQLSDQRKKNFDIGRHLFFLETRV